MKEKMIKVRKPVINGCAKVPVVMQMEALECAAASLAMILAYYDKWIPLEKLRVDCGVSRDGSNAKNVLIAARSYGLVARGYRYEPEDLKKEGQFPCIIHWNFNHFVVLDGFSKGKAVINDPAKGVCKISMEEFDRAFTGICLMFEPGEEFEPGGRPKSVLKFALERLKGSKTAITFVVLTTIISSLIDIVEPAFSRVFIDRLLTHKNQNWTYPFLIAFALLAAIQIAVSAIEAIYLNRINGRLAISGNMSYLWKVLHMPMEFFSQRMSGTILGRQEENAMIANSLVETFTPLVLEAAMMIFYLTVMIRYSPILTLIGIFSIVLDLFISQVISKKRIGITRVQLRDKGKLASATISGIEMIETIKSSGAENGYFKRWSGYQASVNTHTVRYVKLNQYLGMIPSLVSALTDTAILIIGVWLIMQGQFTIGMLSAFQGFLASFTAPANTLISAGQTLQEMRTSMERVEDVMKYPDDPCYQTERVEAAEGGYQKLSGNLELKHITFGYAKLAQPLIEDFCMTVRPGSCVAFIGASGCGKSTLSMLIAGLYQPWSGDILFDGKPVQEIDRDVFKGSVAVVTQDIILFEDTIANNIKMWDSTIEDFEMILAARDAQIHEDIMMRDGGYQYKIMEGGKDFSGGQCQRLEIARVLAQDPSIVIMDEATSALDAKTEYEVVKAIRDRGITCIIVAHRLSTIRDCDEIIVLDHGHVVERGTHEELYQKGGTYTELVTSD